MLSPTLSEGLNARLRWDVQCARLTGSQVDAAGPRPRSEYHGCKSYRALLTTLPLGLKGSSPLWESPSTTGSHLAQGHDPFPVGPLHPVIGH